MCRDELKTPKIRISVFSKCNWGGGGGGGFELSRHNFEESTLSQKR